MLEEPVVLVTIELHVLTHLLREYSVKFVLNRAQFGQQGALLQLDIVKLLHVLLVRILDLTSLLLDSFNFCERLDQQELVIAQSRDSLVELRLVSSDLLLPSLRHVLERRGLESGILRSLVVCFLLGAVNWASSRFVGGRGGIFR